MEKTMTQKKIMFELGYERPEGFEDEKNDCTVRALSIAGNIPYKKVHEAFEKHGRKHKKRIRTKLVINKVLKELDLESRQVKRSGSVRKFISEHQKGNYFCIKRGHAFSIIDGVEHDLEKLDSHLKGAWEIKKIK